MSDSDRPTCELWGLHSQLLDQLLRVCLPLARAGIRVDPSDAQDLDQVCVPLVLGARGDERHVDVCPDAFSGVAVLLRLLVVLGGLPARVAVKDSDA